MPRSGGNMKNSPRTLLVGLVSPLSNLRFLVSTFETKLPSAIDASTSFRAVSLLTLLKQSSKTLSTLSDIFEKAYSSLRALAMPSILHHGLLSLPPEILSYIAKLTHPSSRRPYPVFSLVCRRFREIELSTPELWKFVNGNMSPERIATQIERGGGVDIAFEIIDGGTDYWRCDCLWRCRCKVWAAFATNADKMTSGRVQLNHGSLTEEMFGTPVMHDPGRPIRADEHILCLHKLRGVTLPRLRSLDLDILREEGHGVSFIRTWTMPKLRHLTFRVMIWDRNPDPSSVLPIPAGTKLESLKLKVSWMSGNAHIGFEWIAQLLKSECLSELTRLELTFVETKRYARPWIVEDQPDAVANMRPRFEPMPSITHLHLSLPNINIASPDSPTPSDVSKLSNSSFLVFLLPHLTTLVPNLESLDVTTPCSIIQHPTFWDYLSSLKSLNKRMKDVRIMMNEPALGVEEGHLGGLIRDCVQGVSIYVLLL